MFLYNIFAFLKFSSNKLVLCFILDLSSFNTEHRRFLHPNEQHVNPAVYEAYSVQASEDLTKFLKLRAEELVDNGFGLYLMGGEPVASAKHVHLNFIRKTKPVFTEAFKNAALEFEKTGKSQLARLTYEALIITKFSIFERSCEDIKNTLAEKSIKNLLDLVEINTEECLVDHKTGEGMADFLWSILKNSIVAALATWSEGHQEDNLNLDLASSITEAIRKQVILIAERDFPDGRHYITYTYIVVKRKPRI